MKDKIFVYKLNGENGSRVVYFDAEELKWKARNGGGYLSVEGPRYTADFTQEDYENVETFLSRDLFEILQSGNIKKNEWIAVYKALTSNEAMDFFAKIVQEEIELVTENHDLDEDAVEEIFENSPDGYTDSGLISAVYSTAEEMAKEYVDDTCDVPDFLFSFIDYESLGNDLINGEEGCMELSNGQVVYLNL